MSATEREVMMQWMDRSYFFEQVPDYFVNKRLQDINNVINELLDQDMPYIRMTEDEKMPVNIWIKHWYDVCQNWEILKEVRQWLSQ